MAYDNECREEFEKLKQFSSDKERYISEMVDTAMELVIERRKRDTDEFDDEEIIALSDRAKWILKELYEDYVVRCESENNICDDIEYCGTGFKGIALRVGDNVLKLSKHNYKTNSKSLDIKYQIPTYISEKSEIGKNTDFIIEVSPFVDVNNISFDDAYGLYCNIRRLGYIWNDPKEENIGRIVNVDGCRIGGRVYLPKYQYEKGDLVALDLEDFAYVGEETSDIILEEIATMSYNKNVYIFETKYMENKKEETLGSVK